MTDVSTASDTEGIKDLKKVIDVSIKGGVAAVIEVIRVDAAGANEVIENDAVVASEVREHALPRRLVGAEAVSEDKVFVAGAFYADIKCIEDGSAHVWIKQKMWDLVCRSRRALSL